MVSKTKSMVYRVFRAAHSSNEQWECFNGKQFHFDGKNLKYQFSVHISIQFKSPTFIRPSKDRDEDNLGQRQEKHEKKSPKTDRRA